MKNKNKFKSFLLLLLVVSIFCSLYLNAQLLSINGEEQELVESFSVQSFNEKLVFPEVEVVKVIIEKLINLVTISKV
jgi:hypothetical protein